MENKAQQAHQKAKELAELVKTMINESNDFDLERLLKQIEADLMDVQYKLSLALRLYKGR